MSGARRGRPSAALIVAILALVVALTGNAFAGPVVHAVKKLISGSSIKKHSIAGNRLKNHTLTGQQINLAKLGTVPHAHLADTAASATTLGGAPSSSFLPASKVERWSFKMNKGANKTFNYGPLTFIASCAADMSTPGNTKAELDVKTSQVNTFVSNQPDNLPTSGTTIGPASAPYQVIEDSAPGPPSTTPDGTDVGFAAFDAAVKLAVFTDAPTIGVAVNTGIADCQFFGWFVNDA